jgi:hypothetical protein
MRSHHNELEYRAEQFMNKVQSLDEAECELNRARATRDKDKIRHALGKVKLLKKKLWK